MKKIILPLLLMIVSLQSCLEDPDPLPQTINSYLTFYHYLMEPYDVQWEIDDEVIGTGHSFGLPAEAIAVLDQPEQEVLFRVRESDPERLIDSLSFSLFENASYMIAVMGSEEVPLLLCEPMDTRPPASGMTKLRFMQTAKAMGAVDIYIGGDLPENKVLSGVEYSTVSEYLEITEDKLWNALIISPENTPPTDSVIISYTANTVFQAGWIYLCCISHSESSIESSYLVEAFKQPMY